MMASQIFASALFGLLALTAAALFVQVTMEHFYTKGRQEDVARAAEERRQSGGAIRSFDVNP